MDMHVGTFGMRVVLVAVPPLVRDIIQRTIAQQPDMYIVAEYDGVNSLVHAEEHNTQHNIDVVVLGVSDVQRDITGYTQSSALESPADDSSVPFRILSVMPHARVLAIAVNGGIGSLYVLRPQCLALGEVSPNTLVHALRRDTTILPLWQLAG